MKYKSSKVICLFICILFVLLLLPITSVADTGPKPSVHITFENMGDELCYGTLLSKTPSTGPSSVWNGDERYAYHNENPSYPHASLNYKNWKAFVEYEDADGYYFLQHSVWQVNQKKELSWTYYPPDSFKILLYYPETEKFIVSDVYERYAFDSYYTVDMRDIASVDENETPSNNKLEVNKSYQYGKEILSLVARILITIILEMGIAFLFRFRGKKALLLLAIINTATQIVLNVLLNIINFNFGQSAFVIGYVLLEIAVFAIEAVLYCMLMRKNSDNAKPAWFYVVYALIANTISFGAGIVIANILPGIF